MTGRATPDRVRAHQAGVTILHTEFCVNCGSYLGGWPDDPHTAVDGEHCVRCYGLPLNQCQHCRGARTCVGCGAAIPDEGGHVLCADRRGSCVWKATRS